MKYLLIQFLIIFAQSTCQLTFDINNEFLLKDIGALPKTNVLANKKIKQKLSI